MAITPSIDYSDPAYKLSDDVASLLAEFGFSRMPSDKRDAILKQTLDDIYAHFISKSKEPIALGNNIDYISDDNRPFVNVYLRFRRGNLPATEDERGLYGPEDIVSDLISSNDLICKNHVDHIIARRVVGYIENAKGINYHTFCIVMAECGNDHLREALTFDCNAAYENVGSANTAMLNFINKLQRLILEKYGANTSDFVKREISHHRYFLGQKKGRPIPFSEAYEDYKHSFGNGAKEDLAGIIEQDQQLLNIWNDATADIKI